MKRRHPNARSGGSLRAERDFFKAIEQILREPSDSAAAQFQRGWRTLILWRADDGVPEAQNTAGQIFAKDSPPDLVRADSCFILAAAQGISEARRSHKGLAGKMTPDQLAEAQSLAAADTGRLNQ
jgi:hypothetical protein